MPQPLLFLFRLLVAAVLGGVLGYERQHSGKAAGLRTHMLVALGTATIVVATTASGGDSHDLSRVIQGAAAGIGFIGAGAILKIPAGDRVFGLTTAASIWMTAAIGVAAGLGAIWASVIGAFLAWLILALLPRFEAHPTDRA